MKYMGSKARIAKDILPIILKDRKDGQYYVEPFAGGMNTICEVDGKRIAGDNNKYLIAMWQSLINKGKFDVTDINKKLYDEVRNCYNSSCGIFTDEFIGWIGFMGSANGRFFDGGYSGKSITKSGAARDYIKESISNIEKQIPKMVGCRFYAADYSNIPIPMKSLIYCDIPYKETKQYSTSKDFNYDNFYFWCRVMRNMGHTIFVSEYSMPDDFTCVWEKKVKSSLSANGVIGGNKESVERLYRLY